MASSLPEFRVLMLAESAMPMMMAMRGMSLPFYGSRGMLG